MELSDIVAEVGFKPIAACAFIGEHSRSRPETPLGMGRPDDEDLALAEAFGAKIREKLEGVANVEGITPIKVPGVNPYTLRAGRFEIDELMSPYIDEKLCTKCGNCVKVCPTAAVIIKPAISNPSLRVGVNSRIVSTDEEACIWCCACIKSCPSEARIRRPLMLHHSERLSKTYGEKKVPETYIKIYRISSISRFQLTYLSSKSAWPSSGICVLLP